MTSIKADTLPSPVECGKTSPRAPLLPFVEVVPCEEAVSEIPAGVCPSICSIRKSAIWPTQVNATCN